MVPNLTYALDFAWLVINSDKVRKMLQKLQLITISLCLGGCAPVLLAPVTVAGAAAEQKTGKSPVSTFLTRVTGDDCDVKRVLKADYPCKPKNQSSEIDKSTDEGKK